LGDARNHIEFKEAIGKDMGEADSYEFGQIWLNQNKIFYELTFHYSSGKNDAENRNDIFSLFRVFPQECLNPLRVKIRFGEGFSYYYYPLSGDVARTGFR
jgi:hypothetical protein